MKKYLVLVIFVILICSLPTFAKATYGFENEGDDTAFIAAESYFTIFERTTAMANNGSYGVMAVFDDTSAEGTGGNRWTFHTRQEDDSLLADLEFMVDTVFFWMYLPTVDEGIMEFIQPFTQDVGWRWHGAWQSYSGVSHDQWACYPVHIDTLMWDGSTKRELPILRAGVEFGTLVNEPGCTIYIDDISTRGRTSGITILTDPTALVVPKTSINAIKYSIAESTPVLLSVFNLAGQKVLEQIGDRAAGSHEIAVEDLAAGVYLVKVTAGQVSAIGKLLKIE